MTKKSNKKNGKSVNLSGKDVNKKNSKLNLGNIGNASDIEKIGNIGDLNMDLWIKNARKNVDERRAAEDELSEGRKASPEEIRNVDIIPSKSFAHRALICAALAEDSGKVDCDFESDDILATKNCCAAIRGGYETMECNESGSTLRFLVPVMGALGRKAVFNAKGRLAERPLSPLREELMAHGMMVTPQGENPIIVEGQLEPGIYRLPGNVSSQFISGLLLAMPLLDGDSTLEITGKIESSAYIDITTQVMEEFGVTVSSKNTYNGFSPSENDVTRRYEVKGGQKYICPDDYKIEGDWSGAAFWLAAGVIGEFPVSVHGLNLSSVQGDSEILYILKRFGADVDIQGKGKDFTVTVYPSRIRGIKCDVSEIPDLAPTIALLGAAAYGDTYILNAGRLRLKESDRLEAISNYLKIMGVPAEETEDSLVIHGMSKKTSEKCFSGGIFDSVNDHRMAMMAGIASIASRGLVSIVNHKAVSKSYPNFFETMKELGLDRGLILR